MKKTLTLLALVSALALAAPAYSATDDSTLRHCLVDTACNELGEVIDAVFADTGYSINFDGVDIDLDPTGTFNLAMDAAKDAVIVMSDANANAFQLLETANIYIDVNTTNSSEAITFGNTTTNPDMVFNGSGPLDINLGDIDIDPSGTFNLEMAATKVAEIDVADNLDAAFTIMEATTQYFEIDTQTGSEVINIGNTGDNPTVNFLGTGDITASGKIVHSGDESGATMHVSFPVTFTANATAYSGGLVPSAAITVTGLNVACQAVPASTLGTVLFNVYNSDVDGGPADDLLLSAADADAEGLTNLTGSTLALTATGADLIISANDYIYARAVSNNADMTGGVGCALTVTYKKN